MDNTSKVWAIVPAAGIGSRMQAQRPKQYLPLAGKTVLQVTLDKLQTLPDLAGCIVALSQDDPYFETYCGQTPGITTVVGGPERSISVFQGLTHLMQRGCANDWALVHDAARPCVKPANLRKLVHEVLRLNCGGLLAVPVADTLKQVEDHRALGTVNRSGLWHAHTPQMFRVGELHSALQTALTQNLNVTDEASAMEAVGVRPTIVADSRDNIKITQAEDLALAEWILQQQ